MQAEAAAMRPCRGGKALRRALALLPALWLWCFSSFARADVFVDQLPREDWYRRPLLRLTAFAAGQSDCLLLQAGGESMMIDGGTEPYREQLRDALLNRGVAGFRYLLNTHYHEDHIDGLYWLLRYGFSVGEYLHPYTDYAEKIIDRHARVLAQARREGVPIRQVQNGDQLLLGEAVITLYRYEDGLSVNGKSMIQHIRFGEASLLLLSDIIGDTQSYFLRALPPDVLLADVVKAPHHAITPLTRPFLAATAPKLMLITNDEKTARRSIIQAEANGILWFCSAKRTTVMETDGDDWYVYQREGY